MKILPNDFPFTVTNTKLLAFGYGYKHLSDNGLHGAGTLPFSINGLAGGQRLDDKILSEYTNSATNKAMGKALGGLYMHTDTSSHSRPSWVADQVGKWSTSQDGLCHIGNGIDTITWQCTDKLKGYAVSFSVKVPDSINATFGLDFEGGLRLSWHGQVGWRLSVDGTTYETSANSTNPRYVLLTPKHNHLTLSVDGQKVFAVKTDSVPKGCISLTACCNLIFDHFEAHGGAVSWG